MLADLAARGKWNDFAQRKAPEHIAWLAATRKPAPSRFGPATSMDENRPVISSTTDASATVLAWIGQMLERPDALIALQGGTDGVFLKGSDVCLRSPFVTKHLALYLRDSEAARVTTKQVTVALRALSGSSSKSVRAPSAHVVKAFRVPLSALTEPLIEAGHAADEK